MAHVRPSTNTVQTQPMNNNPFLNFHEDWTVPFCDCGNDIPQCCFAFFCWYCFMCSLTEKVKESKISCCCLPNPLAVYRMKTRSVLHIQGNSCNDHLATFCCPLCAGLQMNNELRARGIA